MSLLKTLGISALASFAVLVAAAVILGLAAPLVAPATSWWLGLALLMAAIAVFLTTAVRRIQAQERAASGARTSGGVLVNAAVLFVFAAILSTVYAGAARGMRLDEALGGPAIEVSAVVLVLGLLAGLVAALAYVAVALRQRSRSAAG